MFADQHGTPELRGVPSLAYYEKGREVPEV